MNTKALEKVALSVRSLSMDAIQKANSGHPGLPLGAAELGAILYGEILRHDPSDPAWVDRDRFVLSAGHGSMFLYSLLHLSGYPISLDDIKSFRQIGSPCAGHPEYGAAPGIETTTGPLGQGIATAVGMAIAEAYLAAHFNTPEHNIINHFTYTLVGDGCLQEGVSAEASSLAGHLKLGKLIAFYDSNKITIDGSTDLSFTEDVAKRYEAYGWQVLKGSMYNFDEIARLVAEAKAETSKPSLIILTSVIGKGAPNKQGSHSVHGAPLGADEIAATRQALGIPHEFYVAPEAVEYFAVKRQEWKKARTEWQARFDAWSKANPDKRAEWDTYFSGSAKLFSAPSFSLGEKIATRTASNKVLVEAARALPNLVGGSADLQSPNAVALPEVGVFSGTNRNGRYIHFGIREFGMAAISNGIQLHGGLRAFCATFLVFADYLRPALRLSALMKQPVIYVLTHDSIYIGEDGPTHQPVEHLVSLRAIPNVRVLRPADAEETALAWEMAITRTDGPTVLALTRQNVPVFAKADPDWKETIKTGAYIVKKSAGKADLVIIATGSEVSLALAAAEKVQGKQIQVVSMISRELFEQQPDAIRQAIVPEGVRTVVVEAGSRLGWEFWAKREDILSVDRFGESGPGDKVAEHLGFTVDALVAIINRA
ncbi:transketolase [Gracilinema caldarium]|uniref:Transketolase n=1 Tax=Gracilinema caldarium (strain ATCC 51460 / DSM 7334 / H1) TaxID=744872 RepID=F8EYI3_GRAC1|nr:transketolase [Gracilinema caldarium]AEJ18415.1 transketolase [Gracilinema caldarium DSM 7334]